MYAVESVLLLAFGLGLAMMILIKNLPHPANNQELIDLANRELKLTAFLPIKLGNVRSAKIFAKKFAADTCHINYGLLVTDTPKAAKRLIAKLNGIQFKNKTLEVRQYFIRQHHDRRTLKLPSAEILNKRQNKNDRRGSAIDIDPHKRYTTLFDF
jgi:hypothetical protein